VQSVGLAMLILDIAMMIRARYRTHTLIVYVNVVGTNGKRLVWRLEKRLSSVNMSGVMST